MPSKHNAEGYLMIDRRFSGGGLLERAVVSCGHCTRQVVLNPDRTRERGYCRTCDSYICDGCVALQECHPIAEYRDRAMTAVARGAPIPPLFGDK